ncbi:MAG: DUF4175 family protein [Planctomycetaceae bacterium]
MSDSLLSQRLAPVLSRMRQIRSLQAMTRGWFVAAGVVALLHFLFPSLSVPLLACAGFVSLIPFVLPALRRIPESTTRAAALVEQHFPDLDSRLLTALAIQRQTSSSGRTATVTPLLETDLPADPIEFPAIRTTPRYGFLESQVIAGVLDHSRQNRWQEAIPGKQLWAARLLQGAGFLVFATLLISLIRPTGGVPQSPTANDAMTHILQGSMTPQSVVVEPGSVEIERGTSLLVTATFTGFPPSEVTLITEDTDGLIREMPLVQALEDPVFGGRLQEINTDLRYSLRYGDTTSESFQIMTYELPRLVRLDADVLPPSYTGLPPVHLPDVRMFSVIEGSTVTLTARLNKPVKTAVLTPIGPQAQSIPALTFSPSASEATCVLTCRPDRSATYQLVLEDAAGRVDPNPTQIAIEVIPNAPPRLAITFPRQDVRVSPLEEVLLEANASDDFGLKQYGVVYVTPNGESQKLLLSPVPDDANSTTSPVDAAEGLAEGTVSSLPKSAQGIGTLLSLEKMQVVPDDLLAYYFFATDIGPDGEARETLSDLFFAEVRPFEEIYRQGPDTPPMEGEGESSETKKLLSLQRQIVSALWNLMRKEPVEGTLPQFADDVTTINESQQEVAEILQQQLVEITDPQLQQHATEALSRMQQTVETLQQKLSDFTHPTLPDARNSAQAAYQALLKMQAREHLVVKQQPSKGKGKPQESERNRQLQALELKNDRNRYETESQAKQQQQQAQQETLQVLSRLRELARRQEEMNERIRQAEAELRNAMSEAEKQEAERKLKRLHEEQQNLLQDLDEARERMNRESVRDQLSESREALDKTRERLFRSAESLKEGQTSQALAEGERARQELEQLQEKIRQQSAGQFDKQVQDLAKEFQEIAKAEAEIAREMERKESPVVTQSGEKPSPSLRPAAPTNRNDVADRLANQQQRVSDALQQMQRLVVDAETAEPLLSRKLYDTIRDARVEQPSEALAAASQLMRRGIEQPAIEAEQQARRGIDKLQAGVEAAAQSILGDQQSASRRARDQLASLTKSIQQELQERTGQSASAGEKPATDTGNSKESPAGASTPSEKPSGNEGGQPKSPSGKPGEGKPSDPMKGGEPGMGESGMGEQGQGEKGQGMGEGQDEKGQGMGEGGMGQQGQGGDSPMSGGSPGQSPGKPSASQAPGPRSLRPGQGTVNGGGTARNGGGNAQAEGAPIESPLTGDDFVAWSDKLRDVEEMVSDPQLRAELTQVRDRAREMRMEFKRHSKQPNWELVRTSIYAPLRELEQRLSDDLARQEDQGKLVPIDRDPVPDQYKDLVRRYYEELSRER